MNSDEQLKDWYIRYNMILKKRYTKKQKKRFLQSFSADIASMRSDTKLDTFKIRKNDSEEYTNFYVGDIEKARTIFCTYYDTPAVHSNSYVFFDKEQQQKNTIKFIIFSSSLYLLLGLIFTWFLAIPVLQQNNLWSFPFIASILFYIVYFYFFRKFTTGWPARKNLVRNTSSVLLLLQTIQSCKQKNIAYAFLDAGCKNDAGLKRLLKISKEKGNIYVLDSIGSNQELFQISKNSVVNFEDTVEITARPNKELDNRLTYLISARQKNGKFQLNKEDLKQTTLGISNMSSLSGYIERIVRGNKNDWNSNCNSRKNE